MTINPDGSPTATPVWASVDGAQVVVNTAIGRRKERNARRDPRVALAMVDRENPYSWIEIRGLVVEFTEGAAADASINALSHKYLDRPYTSPRPDERRVEVRIEPTRVKLNTESGGRRDLRLDADGGR